MRTGNRRSEWLGAQPYFKALNQRMGRTIDLADYTHFRLVQQRNPRAGSRAHLQGASISGVRMTGQGRARVTIWFGGPLFFGRAVNVQMIYLSRWELYLTDEHLLGLPRRQRHHGAALDGEGATTSSRATRRARSRGRSIIEVSACARSRRAPLGTSITRRARVPLRLTRFLEARRAARSTEKFPTTAGTPSESVVLRSPAVVLEGRATSS
ncbi:MAG: hypothetical protein R3E85_05065 [Planctomycetota bacterium]